MFDPLYTYWARIERVVDGDTFVASVDLGFGVSMKHHFRVYGYDAPETHRPSCEAEQKHGLAATAEAKRVLLDRTALLSTRRDRAGKYGRYLADVHVPEFLLPDSPEMDDLPRFTAFGTQGPVGVGSSLAVSYTHLTLPTKA